MAAAIGASPETQASMSTRLNIQTYTHTGRTEEKKKKKGKVDIEGKRKALSELGGWKDILYKYAGRNVRCNVPFSTPE